MENARTSVQPYTPTGVPGGIQPPADLTEAAREVWEVLLDDLTQMGVFREADSIILVEVCEMITEAKALRRRMQNPPRGWYRFEPDLSKDEKDEIALQEDHMDEQLADMWYLSATYKRTRVAYLQMMRTLKSYIDEFGVTPVARLRLGLLQLQGASLGDLFRDEDDAPPITAEVIEP